MGRYATRGVREGRPVYAGENVDGQLGQGDTMRSSKFGSVQIPTQ